MRRIVPIAFLGLLLDPPLGNAQDFSTGSEAAKAGDYVAAFQEWAPLAEQGDAVAQKNLGIMYSRGEGVPQDHAEAEKWYRRAAEQGDAGAQNNLGVMYAQGKGVPQDYITAHMWSNIAASKGSETAISLREKLISMMQPADISEAQRRATRCLASDYSDCQ